MGAHFGVNLKNSLNKEDLGFFSQRRGGLKKGWAPKRSLKGGAPLFGEKRVV